MFGLIPVAESLGLFVLGGVLGFAAVSYVAALRAASKRGMRSKLLPDSVHREISRSRIAGDVKDAPPVPQAPPAARSAGRRSAR